MYDVNGGYGIHNSPGEPYACNLCGCVDFPTFFVFKYCVKMSKPKKSQTHHSRNHLPPIITGLHDSSQPPLTCQWISDLFLSFTDMSRITPAWWSTTRRNVSLNMNTVLYPVSDRLWILNMKMEIKVRSCVYSMGHCDKNIIMTKLKTGSLRPICSKSYMKARFWYRVLLIPK